MAVPKKKTSVSRKGKRRGGHTHKLKNSGAVTTCADSGALNLKGCISPAGYWKGVKVFETKADRLEEVEDSTEAGE